MMSSAMSAGSFWRRKRLRRAMAHRFFGVFLADDVLVQFLDDFLGGQFIALVDDAFAHLQFLDAKIGVGIDADLRGDGH